MRTLVLSAFLATVPLVCLAVVDAKPALQSQEQQPTQTPVQEPKKPAQQPPAGAPVSLSPMIPVAAPAEGAVSPGAAAMAAGGTPKIAPVNARTYIIGPEDIIAINVFENRDFSVAPQAVRVDGRITMPLVGELTASAKTPEELSEEVQKILVERFMKEPPHVQVVVVEVRSRNYYLQGEVNKPGKYPLVVPTTMMQALVNAGGFKDFANRTDIKILRGTKVLKFNFKEAIKGKHPEQNIFLQPDDQIIVK